MERRLGGLTPPWWVYDVKKKSYIKPASSIRASNDGDAHIHRPQKVYDHQHQRGVRDKHQIGRPISREPQIGGCWNFEDFISLGPLTELLMV